MNNTLRRTWPAILLAVLALFYVWIGAAAHGWDRILGLAGGVLILTAIAATRRSVPAAYGLLIVGALPLAIATWWSIATPLLAGLVLLLGWVAVRHLRTPGAVASPPTAVGSRLLSDPAAQRNVGSFGPSGPPPSRWTLSTEGSSTVAVVDHGRSGTPIRKTDGHD